MLNHSGQLHIDAHLTLPVYYLVSDAEKEIEHINRLIKANFGDDVEVFIHIEGCNAHECVHCSMGDCHIRHAAYIHRQEWTLDTIWKANKHAHG
ncbi:MAG: hypothetical protein EBX41_09500 [Chitinophagia bacterium]|nr:hypothetical protein [Chitinophagia bacterium]